MKRTLLLLIVALGLIAAACGPSPRDRAKEFTTFLPEEIGEWELQDNQTAELLTSTVTTQGHVTLQYEGPNDALAYVVIDTYPTNDAADVAFTTRERELLLQGLTLDSDRSPQEATALVTQSEFARIALFNEEGMLVEINALADEDGELVSDEAFADLLAIVRNGYTRSIGD